MERRLVVVIGIFSLAVEISLGEGLMRLFKRKQGRAASLSVGEEALGLHPLEVDRDKAGPKGAAGRRERLLGEGEVAIAEVFQKAFDKIGGINS